MRLLYVSLSYVPSRRASSVQVMKMCAALARQGHEVRLITKWSPPRQEAGVEDPFRFYGVAADFRLEPLRRPDWKGGGVLWLLLLWRRLVARRGWAEVVYSRDLVGAWLASRAGLRVLFEAHAPPRGRWQSALFRRLAPRLERLVVISRALAELYAERGLLPPGLEVVVAHDAGEPAPAAAAGGAVAGDRAAPIRLGYVGHLYRGRGLAMLRQLARRLPACKIHVIGGSEADLAHERTSSAELPNLVFEGFVPPGRLAERYAELDILLMPYERRVEGPSGASDTVRWMSPLKLFEYMAAGKPIVASDLPVLREVLEDGRNALLASPDDPDAWEAAVTRLVDDPALRARLGAAARSDLLREHTWDARARRVLAGL